MDLRTNKWTDEQMVLLTDNGRTKPILELRVRNWKVKKMSVSHAAYRCLPIEVGHAVYSSSLIHILRLVVNFLWADWYQQRFLLGGRTSKLPVDSTAEEKDAAKPFGPKMLKPTAPKPSKWWRLTVVLIFLSFPLAYTL